MLLHVCEYNLSDNFHVSLHPILSTDDKLNIYSTIYIKHNILYIEVPLHLLCWTRHRDQLDISVVSSAKHKA